MDSEAYTGILWHHWETQEKDPEHGNVTTLYLMIAPYRDGGGSSPQERYQLDVEKGKHFAFDFFTEAKDRAYPWAMKALSNAAVHWLDEQGISPGLPWTPSGYNFMEQCAVQ